MRSNLRFLFALLGFSLGNLCFGQKLSELPKPTTINADGRILFLDPDDHTTAATGSDKTIAFSDLRTALAIPSGSGTVTSVGLTGTNIFTFGSPVTGAGTISITLTAQNANLVFAGPASGSAAAPTFRSLVAADLPAISFASLTGKPTTLAGYSITDPIVVSSGTYPDPAWITSLSFGKLTGVPNFLTTTGNGSGLTGITPTQIGLGNVQNTAISTWAGSSNLTTLGTITAGTWHATAIADTYIASAATWNAKQAAITLGTTGQYFRGDLSLATLNSAAVGLGNVQNTALSTWAGSSSLTTFSGGTFGSAAASSASAFLSPTGNGSSLTGLTATQVGLGSVNNTSDAAKNSATVTLTNHTISGASNTITIRLANDVTGLLPVANGGTGTASPGIVAGANVTVTGSFPTQTVAASGGGSSITVPNVAYISPSGDDTTAAIGDPGHPYATPQAAFDDGANTMVLWPRTGSYGGINASADVDIRLIGFGKDVSAMGAVNGAGVTAGFNVTITGNGSGQVKISSVACEGANGANGSTGGGGVQAEGGDGASGGDASDGYPGGNLSLIGLTVGTVIANYGGDGGIGGAGQNVDAVAGGETGGQGGRGGNAGAGGNITCTDCVIGSTITVSTGNPGSGGAGGAAEDTFGSGLPANGGNGGNAGDATANAGVITLIRCTIADSVAGVADGAPSYPGPHGSGINGGSDGSDGGSSNITGAAGLINATFSTVTDLTTGNSYVSGSNIYRFVLEAGISIDTQN